VFVTGALRIPLAHPEVQEIRDNLEFTNPFDDTVFKAYFETSKELIIPRGYPIAVPEYAKGWVETSTDIQVTPEYLLRPYQIPIVHGIVEYFMGLEYGQCLLEAKTGSGKSFSLAGILSVMKCRTLILSHLTMLGDQMLKELTANLGTGAIEVLSAKSIGKPLPDIAISSFKMLENKELLTYISHHYSLVAVDECENAVTRSRLKVLFTLKPQYQIYLTATPSKELVRQTKAVEYLYGGKVFLMEAPEENRVHSKHIMVDFRHLNWEAPSNQMLYKTSLGRFFMRSELLPFIVSTCTQLKRNKVEGTIWIIADLNKFQVQLETRLVKNGLTVGIINGKTPKKKRDVILKQIDDGELDVLIGSAPLSAGLSIPRLSVGIRAMPNSSSEELLEQQTGRLNRHCNFKDYQIPLWLDFAISGNLLHNARKRFELYKKTTYGALMVKPQALITTILKEIKHL
jgi:superfamily II DNA or RNA helicase